MLADVLLGAGEVDRARSELDLVLSRAPRDVGAALRVASLEAGRGEWVRAAEAYHRLVEILSTAEDPDGATSAETDLPRAVLALAESCERAGRPGEARPALEDAVGRHPERICDLDGDWQRLSDLLAVRADRTADPAERASLFLRAAALTDDPHAPENALRLVELARAAHPESIDAALAYARLEMGQKRAHEAVRALEEIALRNAGKRLPVLATVYLQLGKAHLALDQLAEALDALKAGFAIDLRSGDLAMLLGLVALDLGDEKTAERAFTAVVTLARKEALSSASDGRAESVAALCHLASMAHTNGDVPKARRWLGKALSEDPSHPAALALLRRLDDAESKRRARSRE